MKLNMKKAFTLVEMLIVIVIIGILAAALIPRLTGVQSRARDVARKADAQQIGSALATWSLDNGTYIMSGDIGPYTTVANTGTWLEAAWFSGRLNSAQSVQNQLWSLVFRWLLKTLPTESAGLNATAPYVYQYFNSGSVFAITVLSEGGWVNANFISGHTIWWVGATTRIISPSNITNVLCTAVEQGTLTPGAGYATWSTCIANVDARQARYVYSN